VSSLVCVAVCSRFADIISVVRESKFKLERAEWARINTRTSATLIAMKEELKAKVSFAWQNGQTREPDDSCCWSSSSSLSL
jgi:hypothetical protein